MIQGLFGDVLAKSPLGAMPQTSNVDWSKQPGVTANVGWDKLKPFQVIPQEFVGTPYNYSPQEAKAKLDETPTTDTRSEYQKWLESMDKSRGGGERNDNDRVQPTQVAPQEGYVDARMKVGDNVLTYDWGRGAKGFGLFGPMGAAAGITSYKDPLGDFAIDRVREQEAREALAASQAGGLQSAPPGLSPDQLAPAQQASLAAALERIQREYGGGGGYGTGPGGSSGTASGGQVGGGNTSAFGGGNKE